MEQARLEDLRRHQHQIMLDLGLPTKTDPMQVPDDLKARAKTLGRQVSHTTIDSIFSGQLMLIRNYPLMQSLYVKYLRGCGQTELLRDSMIQEDDFSGQARLRITEAYQETRVDLRISHLVAAQDCYKKAKNELFATQTEDSKCVSIL